MTNKIFLKVLSLIKAAARYTAFFKLGLGMGIALGIGACSNQVPKPAPLQNLDRQVKVQPVWRTDLDTQQADTQVELVPVINKNVLIVANSEGKVTALSDATGAVIWQTSVPSTITAGISSDGDYVLVATQAGNLHALSRIDGRVFWDIPTTSEVLAPPQVQGELVVVQTVDGRITTYNISDGKEVWSFISPIPSLTLRGTSAPLIDGAVVYAGFANGKVIALDLNTGDVIWQQSLGLSVGQDIDRLVDVDSTLHLVNEVLYASSFQGDIAAINSVTGQIIWRQPANRVVSIAVDNNHVYSATQNGTIQAYLSQTGEPVWQNDQLLYRSLLSIKPYQKWLIVFDAIDYHLLNVDTKTLVGRLYTHQAKSSVGALVFDDTLYSVTNKGSVFKIILANQ